LADEKDRKDESEKVDSEGLEDKEPLQEEEASEDDEELSEKEELSISDMEDDLEDMDAESTFSMDEEYEEEGIFAGEKTGNRKKSYIIVGVVALLVAALGASALFGVFDMPFAGDDPDPMAEEGMPGQDEMDMMDPESGDVVATVNGEEIYEGELEMTMQQVMQQQGIDPQDEQMGEMQDQLKQDILDDLITTTLLAQKAEEKGLQLTDEEVEEEYQAMAEMSGGLEQFEQQLQMMGQSPEAVKDEIKTHSAPQLYFENHFRERAEEEGIEVSEEEIEEEYEEIIEMSGGEEQVEQQLAMSGETLDDLRESIEAQVLGQKYIEEIMEDVEFSEEELQQLYQQQYMGQEDVEFEEVKPELETMMLFQNYQQQHLDDLKQQANIDINI